MAYRKSASFGSGLLMCAGALSLAACIEPTNPCDPSADPALQAQGTRVSGVVEDTDGNPLGGVPIAVAGRPDTTVSAEDGTFTLADLPPSSSIELVAVPQPPAVGGRTQAGALTCGGALDDVVLRVVVPPASPEVELVKASGDQRLLVAFGGVSAIDPGEAGGMYDATTDEYRAPEEVMGDCESGVEQSDVSFRVQVRSPFGAWRDAVLTPFPWSDSPPDEDGKKLTLEELADSKLYTQRIDDTCGAALCSQFAQLDDALASPLARCAEVVGLIENDVVEPLEPFASYHVRVLSEKQTPEALRESAALPVRVEGAAAASTGQMTLVPGAFMNVANADGTELDARDAEVLAVVPTAGGRFAVLAEDGVTVVGDGADTMDEAARATYDGTQNAMSTDATCSEVATAEMMAGAEDVRPVAVLPAGQWARVLRTSADGPPQIKKLYMGTDAADAAAGPDPMAAERNELEPGMMFDVEDSALGAPRAFTYLVRPHGSIATETMNPPDAYVILFGQTLVLSEQRKVDGESPPLTLAYFTPGGAGTPADGPIDSVWADDVNTDRIDNFAGQNAALFGTCETLRGELDSDGDGISNIDELGDTAASYGTVETMDDATGTWERTLVCYDVGAGLDDEVDLTDVEILDDGASALDSFVLISDRAQDRVLAARTRDVTCADCGTTPVNLGHALLDGAIGVGREPTQMSRSQLVIDCSTTPHTRLPVVLVANRRSGDVSVLAVEGDRVIERAIVPMPANIVGFVEDADGPTCEDPFAWAFGEDGRVFPIDMRGAPASPLCDGRPCEVGTRGRGATGAIGRRGAGPLAGRARSIIGGPGLLGELGFFKPKALEGAAFAAKDEFNETGTGSRAADGEASAEPDAP